MGQSQSDVDKEVTLQNIQELYRKFASECPSGNLHLHEFKKIFGVTCKSAEEEAAYMENVFRSFDTNKVRNDVLWQWLYAKFYIWLVTLYVLLHLQLYYSVINHVVFFIIFI